MFGDTALRISTYQPRTAMSLHEHDEPSMGIVLSGTFLERIGNAERTYSRGTCSLCPAGTRHSQLFGERGVRQIIFKPATSWLEYLEDCKTPLNAAPHAHSGRFRDLGDKLLAEMRQDDGFSSIASEGIMLEIVAAFGRDGAESTQPGKPPSWLRAARDYVHVNAYTSVTMAQIAREAGRHEIHLAREFRRFFGCSVGAYVRRRRIERAQQLLSKPDPSISEVAMSCGFASHSHLCREFKASVGVTPSDYRLAQAGLA